MHEVHTAALLLHADIFQRGKQGMFALIAGHGDAQHMIRRAVAVSDHIAAIQLNDVAGNKAFLCLVALLQGHIRIEETVIRGDQDMGAIHVVGDHAHQVFDLADRLFASFKYLIFCGRFVADRIDSVVVDIHDLRVADGFAALRLLHGQQRFICDCQVACVSRIQHLATVLSAFGG